MSDFGMMGLLNPEWAARAARNERAAEDAEFARLKKEGRAQDWDEARTAWDRALLLRAKSFTPTQLFDVAPLRGAPGDRLARAEKAGAVARCPGAPQFLYVNHVLPAGRPLNIYRGKAKGRVYFTGPVTVPTLCEQTPYESVPRVWMSLTPNEMLTQRPGLRRARGRVVVGGLGLGWFLDAVCRRPRVAEVVLAEKEKALLDWLRPRVEACYPAVRARGVVWRHADVYDVVEEEERAGTGAVYLLDIWSDYGGYRDRRYEEWRDRLPPARLWGWGATAD